MAFHEVRFPPKLSFGSLGGPERRTEIVTLSNGFEERNSPWAHSRRRYDAGLGLRSLDDVAALIAFYEARGWHPFSGEVTCEQPSGQIRFEAMAPFVNDIVRAPRQGRIDLCGLPW